MTVDVVLFAMLKTFKTRADVLTLISISACNRKIGNSKKEHSLNLTDLDSWLSNKDEL